MVSKHCGDHQCCHATKRVPIYFARRNPPQLARILANKPPHLLIITLMNRFYESSGVVGNFNRQNWLVTISLRTRSMHFLFRLPQKGIKNGTCNSHYNPQLSQMMPIYVLLHNPDLC
eukprot:XP_001709035.1 Hypothetical protein GL50803_20811 [Giardia lamblia ATCC 50803]